MRSLNSCYDAQISVFGLRLQQKLEDAKVFVVGSGALGCSNGYSISYGSCMLYNCMFQRHAERMDKNMVDLVVDVAKAELPAYRHHFDVVVVACEDEDDNDVDIPLVCVYFK